jgi:hypothetical protein
MADPLWPIQTIRYKTYLKEALVEALRTVLSSHPDSLLQNTKVDIEWPSDQASYPAIIVRYYERNIRNAGVAHEELLDVTPVTDPPSAKQVRRYRHLIYTGDVEFGIYALSSYDRDLIADSLVEIMMFADIEPWTNQLLSRIYDPDLTQEPTAVEHFINLNTDSLGPFGEVQNPVPWQDEDEIVFSVSYRLSVMGEVYSRTPDNQVYGVISRVDLYPWIDGLETKPNPHPEDPTPWTPTPR